MADADWILTFDDGPLPADATEIGALTFEELLAPLARILHVLETHAGAPLPAVFYLRGPGFPWKSPPDPGVFQRGVEMILGKGHHVGIHCFDHDPHIWWGAADDDARVRDLERWMEFFVPMLPERPRLLRPAYGACDPAVSEWARQNDMRIHTWEIDTQDWLHHADATVQQFECDADEHLRHVLGALRDAIADIRSKPGGDLLLHVSRRTADMLPAILDGIVEASKVRGVNARFTVPPSYIALPQQSA